MGAKIIAVGFHAPRPKSMFPREHGASMQLLFALLTAFLLARPSWASIALGVASIAVFCAHEPAMILAGRRGQPRLREDGGRARRWLAALTAIAAALTLFAAIAGPKLAIAALSLPVALGVAATVLAGRGEERALGTELLASLALASVSVPIARASGVALLDAAGPAIVWALTFAIETVAARGVLHRVQDGGRGLRATLVLAPALLAIAVATLALAPVPASWALAPIVPAVASFVVALRPPSPKQMARLGILLTAASAIALVMLVS